MTTLVIGTTSRIACLLALVILWQAGAARAEETEVPGETPIAPEQERPAEAASSGAEAGAAADAAAAESEPADAADLAEDEAGAEAEDAEVEEALAEAERAAPPRPDERRGFGIEEIKITSQGREQTLQEASISVAAFDAEYLEALGAQNIADIAQFTPNLEIRTVFSASNPTLFIRGVGLRDFNANSASSVAVYNDDVYMNSPAGQLGQLFDLEQVEVLRGPQGALYGRNASAGAIRILSRKPSGDEMSGFVTGTYGNFDRFELEGALETVLVPDLLSARVSGVMHRRDGVTANRCADDRFWRDADGSTSIQQRVNIPWRVFKSCFNGDAGPNALQVGTRTAPSLGGQGWNAGGDGALGTRPSPPGILNAQNAVVPDDIARKVNNVDDWAGRALLRLQPEDGSDWILNVHGGRNRGLSRQFQMLPSQEEVRTGDYLLGRADIDTYIDPDTLSFTDALVPQQINPQRPEDGDVYAGDYNLTGPEDLDLFGTNLTGEIPVGNFTVRSITAFEWNERFVASNVDGSPYIGLEVDFSNEAWQVSEEVKSFWDAGGDFTWQGGLKFLFEELDVVNDFLFNPGSVTRQDYRQLTYYGSAYGYATWEPAGPFSIEGGLRWNIEHKDFDISAGLLVPGQPLQQRATDITEHAPSGDLSVNYRPRDGINFYAKYSRGWKGPHFNGNVFTTSGVVGADLIEPVAPESVNALELGLKSKWLDNRLRAALATFYYDFSDIQIFQVRNTAGGLPVQELINANDADVYGIELELEARPLEGWTPGFLEGLMLYGQFAWLESRYTDFVDEEITIIGVQAVPRTRDFSGNRLINAPQFAFAGYAQWDLVAGRYGTITPRFDWSYKDRVYFSPANIEPVSQGALWLLNARLGYRTPDDRIELAGWVRNLTDEIYRIDVIDLTRFQWSIQYIMGTPRMYGVTLSLSF